MDNNGMMQFVTCNKFSLFAPRLKALEKQIKDKYICKTRKCFKCFEA
jgi:hypothetical protein